MVCNWTISNWNIIFPGNFRKFKKGSFCDIIVFLKNLEKSSGQLAFLKNNFTIYSKNLFMDARGRSNLFQIPHILFIHKISHVSRNCTQIVLHTLVSIFCAEIFYEFSLSWFKLKVIGNVAGIFLNLFKKLLQINSNSIKKGI
jgi:hypothetical protein